MEEQIQLLKKIGLTEYESKVYLAFLINHCDSASSIAKTSKVPRTKIYQVLEALAEKGCVDILSGSPLLFVAVSPLELLKEYEEQFSELMKDIDFRRDKMRDKYIVDNYDVKIKEVLDSLENAKKEIWISNATENILKKLEKKLLQSNCDIKIVMFPKEIAPDEISKKAKVKESKIQVVHVFNGKERPAVNIIIDKKRVFNLMDDKKIIIQEMLYESAKKDFIGYFNLGWRFAKG
ncbi:MAG: helix-turn-helix domain-containing protein [Candidatus Micrarchaeota archaeon]|nr:hypothetical protein [Patescibacteria group bacterium]